LRVAGEQKARQRGSENTHWRTGTCGITPSTQVRGGIVHAAAGTGGQKPRPLQEKATSSSAPQAVQRTRAKPLARIPHLR